MNRFIFIHTHPVQYFAPLYRYLTERGVALQVWYADEGASIRERYDPEFATHVKWDLPLLEGYSYRFFENTGTTRNHQRNYASYNNPALLEALKKEMPSIVVVHGWNYSTYVKVLMQAKNFGHRLAFRGETNIDMEMSRPRLQRLWRKKLLNYLLGKVDIFCYIGQKSRAFYEYLGIPADKLRFTPYAVDNAHFRQLAHQPGREEARARLGYTHEDRVFLYTGKFIDKKRPLDLINAMSMLTAPYIKMLMVGDGPLRGEMEALIREKEEERRIRLTGFVNQSAIPDYYRLADGFIMASDYGETWGLSVNEAMNFSLPLLLSDRVGCTADLLQEEVNGHRFTCGDNQDLAAALYRFAYMPKPVLEAMGAASRKIVEDYSFEKIYEATQRMTEQYI